MGVEVAEAAFDDGLPGLPDDGEEIGQVMDGVEAEGEQLLADIEVPQIGAAEGPAGVAVAAGVQRAVVFGKFAALDIDLADGGVEGSVTGVAGGQHAVKHVDARGDAGHDVQRRAHAHEIPGLVGRKLGSGAVDELVEGVFVLAHGQTADGETVEVVGTELLNGTGAQILEETALRDGKKQVGNRTGGTGRPGAQGPAGGQLERTLGIGVVRAVGNAFIQHHHDVGIEIALNADHAFRREEML